MPYRAVICDDEVSIVNELKEAISWKDLGIELVGFASRGKEALELILRTQPDLAVMDIRMPEMTGLEIISEVRRAHLDTDFLILSGYNEFAYAKEAIRLGAKAYLLKPLNISELYDEVYRICSSRSGSTPANHRYLKKLTSNFLRNLIGGRILSQNSLDAMLCNTSLSVRDTESYCIVLSFEKTLEEQTALSVQHRLETLFSYQACVFFPYNGTQIIGIFNTDTEDPMLKAMKILEILKENNYPVPYIGIGDTVRSLIQSSYSYSRAITSITYRLYGGDNHIYSWQMICTVSPKRKISDIDYLPLVQHIVRHDIEGIQKFCDQFLNELP